jgi:hypothetical protein
MEIKDAIRLLKTEKGLPRTDYQLAEALQIAISALEFKERYDQFWEEVKTAGKRGKEVEIHHSGRVFRIREVAQ